MNKFILVFILLLGSCNLFATSNSEDDLIHEELRNVLKGIEKAVNNEEYKSLKQYLHKDLKITMSNQEFLTSYEDVDKFFDFWFGEKGFLKRVEMKLNANSLTKLYANKSIGIVQGTGIENTYLSDERFFPIKTRWSATVIKDTDKKWKILSLHLGVDFLDNPILDFAKSSSRYVAIFSGIGGTVLGLLLGIKFWRKRKKIPVD